MHFANESKMLLISLQADIASMDKILGELTTLSAREQEDAIGKDLACLVYSLSNI